MNISFKAINVETSLALNTEITGQMNNLEHEQLPDARYREFSNYEANVINSINKKAKSNNIYDVFVTKSNKASDYANEDGDCLSIVERKSGKVIKNMPNALGKNLSSEQMINNLKYAADLAGKMAEESKKGILGRIGGCFKKPVEVEMNSDSNVMVFDETFWPYEIKDNSTAEEIKAPKKEGLDVEGLEIKADESDLSNYQNFKNKNENYAHNIIQRCCGNADTQIKLENFLKDVSEDMEKSNTFTQETYNKLSEKQKEKLRDFVRTKYSFALSRQNTKTFIDVDTEYLYIFSNVMKQNLDKKYGEGNYVLFGLGSSPACMLSLLKEEGTEAVNIPLSRSVLSDDGLSLKDSKNKINWSEYLKPYGLSAENIEKLKKENKKVVIIDYCDSGKTKKVLEKILKSAGISDKDYSFEDMTDLCNHKNQRLSYIFTAQFLETRKAKLYSTCPNTGNTPEFYKKNKPYTEDYKWNPLTKLLFFAYFDKKDELKEKFANLE